VPPHSQPKLSSRFRTLDESLVVHNMKPLSKAYLWHIWQRTVDQNITESGKRGGYGHLVDTTIRSNVQPEPNRSNVNRAQVGRGNRTRLCNLTKTKVHIRPLPPSQLDIEAYTRDTHKSRPRLISSTTHLLPVTLDKTSPVVGCPLLNTHPQISHDVAQPKCTSPPASAPAKSSTTTTLTAKATYRRTMEARWSM